MKAFARKRKHITYEEMDLSIPIRQSLLLIGQQLEAHQIDLSLELDPQAPNILGEPYQVEQIIVNLINNSRDALDEKAEMLSGGQKTNFRKKIVVSTRSEGDKTLLMVRDNGTGMPDKIRRQVFEPFFSTKHEKKGTGLGMSITYNLVKNMNADISVHSQENKGTLVTIRFRQAGVSVG